MEGVNETLGINARPPGRGTAMTRVAQRAVLAVDPGTVIAWASSGTTSSRSPEIRVPIREQSAGPLWLTV